MIGMLAADDSAWTPTLADCGYIYCHSNKSTSYRLNNRVTKNNGNTLDSTYFVYYTATYYQYVIIIIIIVASPSLKQLLLVRLCPRRSTAPEQKISSKGPYVINLLLKALNSALKTDVSNVRSIHIFTISVLTDQQKE